MFVCRTLVVVYKESTLVYGAPVLVELVYVTVWLSGPRSTVGVLGPGSRKPKMRQSENAKVGKVANGQCACMHLQTKISGK